MEELYLEFAKLASQYNSWIENAEEECTDPVRVNSLREIAAMREDHEAFKRTLVAEQDRRRELESLDARIKAQGSGANPYTWFTVEGLAESWSALTAVIADRELDLASEQSRQEANEKKRVEFAKNANAFAAWLSSTRQALVQGSGTLEDQLDATRAVYRTIEAKKVALKTIEELGAKMEEDLILDNQHTDHSTVSLAQQWDQLEQLGTRMTHNLEQQIAAKDASGVSEEQLREYTETFRHFDRDNSNMLDHDELKACLRSLGENLPVLEEGESDPKFEAILKQVDPNGDGFVSQGEFTAFMIAKNTSNVESLSDVAGAFASSANDKPYVTAEELRKVLTPDQADYCVRHMRPYIDRQGLEVGGGYDFREFVSRIFGGGGD